MPAPPERVVEVAHDDALTLLRLLGGLERLLRGVELPDDYRALLAGDAGGQALAAEPGGWQPRLADQAAAASRMLAQLLDEPGSLPPRDLRDDERVAGSPASDERPAHVWADDVRAALPADGEFTLEELERYTGAPAAVVRRVVEEEAEAGRLATVATERGAGRARYRRSDA